MSNPPRFNIHIFDRENKYNLNLKIRGSVNKKTIENKLNIFRFVKN